jgi:hypothetical protein
MTKAAAPYSRKTSPGQRFNRLTAVKSAGREAGTRRKILWRFRCDCGTMVVARLESVRSGNTKSCGCQKREAIAATGRANRKHGLDGTKIYRAWRAMLNRCENPKTEKFEYYGGRGIRVCAEWHSVHCFRDWALANGFAEHLTLDRYPDRDGNYMPSNCRWATWSEQALNRRPKRADRRYHKKPPPIDETGGSNL